jgi:hypothetical protein
MEFPHLWRLMEENQFDTIYHEHFSYLSFTVARDIFAAHGLRIFDVERLPTHGGSCASSRAHRLRPAAPRPPRAAALAREESADGFRTLARYQARSGARRERPKRDAARVPDRGAACRASASRHTARPARATRS